ncbi:vgr related protein [Sphingomonas oleivorans]|uniref:Vgr related protein n=1 Tax=Sphingomonas oleivorans TaxID=1735121 RepID=A0A2T5FTD6_9SPHN|nr:vgr related protein [Sphingomonas oleivorans]PTQ07327.1 vgr related protein [Sphingomonas oleivorans]
MKATDATRPLTEAERRLAASMFGAAIDYDPVRVNRRKWWPFQSRGVAMSPDGHLWFHPLGHLWCEDFAAANRDMQGLFIHEMTHVWQHQKGIYLPVARHPFCRYSYALKPGWRLERYGIEQQAEIVRHAFLLRRGVRVPGAPALAQYESILPFRAA